MKYTAIPVIFLLCLAGLIFADSDHDDDEIILKLAPGVSIDTINARYNTVTDEILIRGTVYKVKVLNPAVLDATLAAMQQDPDILQVEFNYIGDTPEGVRRTLAVVDGDPNPSKYQDQEVFHRISGPQAQTVTTGTGVLVAVIDTGVDYNHPALASHILRDSGGNVIGYDFVDNDADPMDESNPDVDADQDGQKNEGWGHGTHVAGIIALVAPDAKILPVRVLNSDGVNVTSAVAKGIEWAVEYAENADVRLVVNLSMGLPTESFLMLEALQEALEEGFPVIASAGNDNSSAKHYPAANDSGAMEVISVTGTDPGDLKADFSNYGKGWIDLSAPAVGIYSTYPGGEYAWWDGTSMAAPFVSGEAALVFSRMLADNPGEDFPLQTVLNPIKNAADYIYDVNPLYKKRKQLGGGRINLYSAVQIAGGSDVLTVKKGTYTDRGKLVLKVHSSMSPAAELNVEGFGTMKFLSRSDIYKFTLSMSVPPDLVTVTSSKGGVINILID